MKLLFSKDVFANHPVAVGGNIMIKEFNSAFLRICYFLNENSRSLSASMSCIFELKLPSGFLKSCEVNVSFQDSIFFFCWESRWHGFLVQQLLQGRFGYSRVAPSRSSRSNNFARFYSVNRGERGIRTPGPREGSTVFKTAAFDRSAISLTNEIYSVASSFSLMRLQKYYFVW